MSVDDVEDPMLTDLLRVLGYDPSEPTSIYFCYAAAWTTRAGPAR